MALRDQPYFPLYVQDFLTDEKLNECSAESTGVYIRLMCIMHKSHEYGKILLKQKDKQNGNKISDFAAKLARQMPYSVDVIESALAELLDEEVLSIDGDCLFQKRMVKDAELSETRAFAGRQRKSKSKKQECADSFAGDFAIAKTPANAENENESENESENENGNGIKEVPITRHKRGTYGWVKLSDEEYSRLLNELGQAELERCIQYLDESAQSNGNKNKWRDWNLVIRRCHRGGWGLRSAAPPGNPCPGKGRRDGQFQTHDAPISPMGIKAIQDLLRDEERTEKAPPATVGGR